MNVRHRAWEKFSKLDKRNYNWKKEDKKSKEWLFIQTLLIVTMFPYEFTNWCVQFKVNHGPHNGGQKFAQNVEHVHNADLGVLLTAPHRT